jgi:hypothetical protein
MRIDSAGNVGIGTSSPSAKFVVSNAGASGVEIAGTGGGLGGSYIQSYNRSTSAYSSLDHYASSYAWSIGVTERMRITSAGGISFGSSGTAFGSSGQLLQSAGNASPTWVNQSSITSGACSGNAATATAAAGSGFFTQATGSEGNIGCRFSGQNDVYMFNNASQWGIYSASGGGAFTYTRSSGLFAFNGSSTSCTGNAATATTASNSNALFGYGTNNVVYGTNGAAALDSISDMNSLSQRSGYYLFNTPANAPTASWQTWMNAIGHYPGDRYGWQLSEEYWDRALYVRGVTNNNWQPWRQIDSSYVYVLGADRALGPGVNTESSLFGAQLDLEANCTYEVVITYFYNKTASTSTNTNYFRVAGTASFLNINLFISSYYTSSTTIDASPDLCRVTSISEVSLGASSTTAVLNGAMTVSGTIVTGGAGGTFNPTFRHSAAAATTTGLKGSYIKVRHIRNINGTISVGPWSGA